MWRSLTDLKLLCFTDDVLLHYIAVDISCICILHYVVCIVYSLKCVL